MNITLNLQPDIERSLLARAQAKGLSLSDYALELIVLHVRSAESETATTKPAATPPRTGQALIDSFAQIRGLLTEEEVETLFSRTR